MRHSIKQGACILLVCFDLFLIYAPQVNDDMHHNTLECI